MNAGQETLLFNCLYSPPPDICALIRLCCSHMLTHGSHWLAISHSSDALFCIVFLRQRCRISQIDTAVWLRSCISPSAPASSFWTNRKTIGDFLPAAFLTPARVPQSRSWRHVTSCLVSRFLPHQLTCFLPLSQGRGSRRAGPAPPEYNYEYSATAVKIRDRLGGRLFAQVSVCNNPSLLSVCSASMLLRLLVRENKMTSKRPILQMMCISGEIHLFSTPTSFSSSSSSWNCYCWLWWIKETRNS